MRTILTTCATLVVLAATVSVWADDSASGRCHGLTMGFADIGEAELYYEERGCGEPVVLLHGLTLDTRMWDPQFRVLALRYRTIRYDARGHGQSDGILGPVSHHEDLAAFLDALEIDSAHLVGLSMGGTTAIDFALAYPERVRSLALLDSGLGGFPYPMEPGTFADRLTTVLLTQLAFGLEAAMELWLADPLFAPANALPPVRERLERIVLRDHVAKGDGASGAVNTAFNVFGLEPPAIGRLDEITAPTLVVVGEIDLPESRDIADVLALGIPGSLQVVLPGAGHMVNLERPRTVNALLVEFLRAQATAAMSP